MVIDQLSTSKISKSEKSRIVSNAKSKESINLLITRNY
jgi:hypothetical protein